MRKPEQVIACIILTFFAILMLLFIQITKVDAYKPKICHYQANKLYLKCSKCHYQYKDNYCKKFWKVNNRKTKAPDDVYKSKYFTEKNMPTILEARENEDICGKKAKYFIPKHNK